MAFQLVDRRYLTWSYVPILIESWLIQSTRNPTALVLITLVLIMLVLTALVQTALVLTTRAMLPWFFVFSQSSGQANRLIDLAS